MREVAVDRSSRSWLRVLVGVALTVGGVASLLDGLSMRGEPALVRIGLSLGLVFLAATAFGPLYVAPLGRLAERALGVLTGVTGNLAGRNAQRNPARTSTTAAALSIGVGLVTVIAILAASLVATRNTVTEESLIGDLVVLPDSFSGITPQLADELAGINGVEAAMGFRLVLAEVRDSPRALVAVDPALLGALIDINVVEGSLDTLDTGGIAVNSGRASRWNLAVGDEVPVVFARTGPQRLPVVAIYDNPPLVGRGSDFFVSHQLYDDNVAENDRVDIQVAVAVAEGADPDRVRNDVAAVVARYPTAELFDLAGLQQDQARQVNQFLAFLYALLGLSVLIGLIGIVNTLLLSVVERTRELGLIRAVGGRRGQIAAMVIQESAVIAVIGTVTGTIIGVFYGWALIRGLASEGPDPIFTVPYGQLAVTVLIAAAAGIVAGLWPARRASRLDVLEAIATE